MFACGAFQSLGNIGVKVSSYPSAAVLLPAPNPYNAIRTATLVLVLRHAAKHSSARITMCRNIKTLHNFKPPATDDEIRASALQFVRKLTGFTRPSKANQLAFERAVDEVARTARELLDALVTAAPPRNRDDEEAKARAKAIERYRPANATT